MIPPRSLRWAGAGISNGRQRLIGQSRGIRNYSFNVPRSHTPRLTRFPPPVKNAFTQQSRTLSLFGWGGSSKSSIESTSTSSSSNIDITQSTSNLDNVRTIKASHSTSDIPDPTQAHLYPPNKVEPQIIEDFQEKITLPHGEAAQRITEIASGQVDISSAPERMGYLREVCGLDFGWGPSTVMQSVLEWLHINGGLSWTVSIIAVAVALRLAMVKPLIDSQKQGKKMREIQPYMKPLREKYMQLMQSGNQAQARLVGIEMRELNKSSGVSMAKAFVPLLIQFPFSYGAFRMLRNAGNLPVPAFVTENWLWTTDLSFSDPYYLTPAISAACIYFSFKMQSASQQTMFGPQMMKVLGTGLPIMSFVFMSFQPGAVQLYFMTTGALALGTTALFRQQWFRDLVDLGPVPGAPTPPPIILPSAQTKPADQATTRPPPANIQIIPPKPPVAPPQPIEPVSQPESNRSMIDQAVDKVKGSWSDLKTGAMGKGSVFEKKAGEQEQKRKTAASARYHATRQMQLNKERETRNQQARERQ